MGQGTLIKIL